MTKILLVEDDQFLLKMYRKKFEVAGYAVEVAHDGVEGLEKMKSIKPDLVIMDVMMPKMNGLEATEKAKADPEIKDIPILIFTNLSGTEDASTAVERGAVDYLVKSDLTPTQVVDKVKAILNPKE